MKRTNRGAWGLATILAVLVLGIGRQALPAQPTHENPFNLQRFLASPECREIPFRMDLARTIVAAVKRGSLRPDRNGRVILPASLASATKDGSVYVTRKRNRLLLILFPTWRGKAWNLHGYLFSSRPLTNADLRWSEPIIGRHVKLRYFPFRHEPGMPAAVEVAVIRTVRRGWYYVARSLD